MSVEYSTEIENKILSHLDGWVISSTLNDDPTPSNDTTDTTLNDDTTDTTSNETTSTEDVQPYPTVEPFITTLSNYQDAPNKRITSNEVQGFYEEALTKSYQITNRLNVNDLTTIEEGFFIDAVCLLTASDLWNKFNIRVNNEDMEDTYVQSYGGLLYQQAMTTLKPFINQRIVTSTSLRQKREANNTNNSVWG